MACTVPTYARAKYYEYFPPPSVGREMSGPVVHVVKTCKRLDYNKGSINIESLESTQSAVSSLLASGLPQQLKDCDRVTCRAVVGLMR